VKEFKKLFVSQDYFIYRLLPGSVHYGLLWMTPFYYQCTIEESIHQHELKIFSRNLKNFPGIGSLCLLYASAEWQKPHLFISVHFYLVFISFHSSSVF